MRSGNWLRFGAPVASVFGPDACEGEQLPIFVEREPDHLFLVSGFGSDAYSAKLLAGTKHRFSGVRHMRQCGDDVFQMLLNSRSTSDIKTLT
jgi:hypothetical protein